MYLRTLFGESPYRRYLSVPLLSLYCALLVATAVPQSLLPQALVPAHRASSIVFKDGLGYLSGVNLFHGVALDRKVTGLCLVVIGVHAGQERLGFQTFPGCVTPTVQFRHSSVGFGLSRVAWVLSSGGRNAQSLSRNDDRLARFGRYFCRSEQSPLVGSDDVVFVVDLELQDHATSHRSEQLRVLHVEPCRARDASSQGYVAHRRPDGQISVLPAGDS